MTFAHMVRKKLGNQSAVSGDKLSDKLAFGLREGRRCHCRGCLCMDANARVQNTLTCVLRAFAGV